MNIKKANSAVEQAAAAWWGLVGVLNYEVPGEEFTPVDIARAYVQKRQKELLGPAFEGQGEPTWGGISGYDE